MQLLLVQPNFDLQIKSFKEAIYVNNLLLDFADGGFKCLKIPCEYITDKKDPTKNLRSF